VDNPKARARADGQADVAMGVTANRSPLAAEGSVRASLATSVKLHRDSVPLALHNVHLIASGAPLACPRMEPPRLCRCEPLVRVTATLAKGELTMCSEDRSRLTGRRKQATSLTNALACALAGAAVLCATTAHAVVSNSGVQIETVNDYLHMGDPNPNYATCCARGTPPPAVTFRFPIKVVPILPIK
jgi:hypothetical protein